MDIVTVTPPAAEPVSLAEAKAHLRIDHADEDAQIGRMIRQAREAVEAFTRLRLITQTLRLTADAFGNRLALPVWPVQSVTSVVYDAPDGTETTLAADRWRLVASAKPRVLEPAFGTTWPPIREQGGAVRVTVVAGFGADGTAVPADLVAALLMRLGSLYAQREGEIVGAPVAAPAFPERALMTPHVFY